MATRFWLCIKSGERRDETIAIPDEGFVVGRSPECGLSLTAAGLSGKHARFELESDGVRVTDLESRNGTKVDGVKVTGRLLAHGDLVELGKLELELVDQDLSGEVKLSGEVNLLDEVNLEAPANDSMSLSHIDHSQVQKGGGLSPILIIAILLAVGAGGFYGYQKWGGGEAVSVQARAAVVPVAGNLLSDGSFEQATTLTGWVDGENSPFEISASHRNRGELGLGAHLTEGERVRIASPWSSVRVGRVIAAAGQVRLRGGVAGSLLLELGRSADEEQSLEIPGLALTANDGFAEFNLSEQVLPGFDRARLVLNADVQAAESKDHMLSLDDVALTVSTNGAGQTKRFEEFELFSHGANSDAASLICIDDLVATAIQFTRAGQRLGFKAEPTTTGWKMNVPSGDVPLNFQFVISDALVSRGMATMQSDEAIAGQLGNQRIQSRSGEFKAEGVSAFIAGEGNLLLRLGFSSPQKISSQRSGDGMLIMVSAARDSIDMQLNFQAERNRAEDLAAGARRADRAGEPGLCLSTWGTMLATVPFDAKLVAEANAARSRHLSAGLKLVEVVRADFERAQFFKLPDIYRGNANRVREIQTDYAGSEVAEAAARLGSEIDAELATYSEMEQVLGQAQLKRVAEALDGVGAGKLADHVRQSSQAQSTGSPATAASSNKKAGL